MTTAIADVHALEARHVLQTYRRNAITFVRGEGVRLYDSEGREYLDLLSGIGVASLGHAHAGLARAIADLSARFDPRDPGPRPLSRRMESWLR